MKYLLKSNEFSWDSDTKRWTLRLTEKLRTNRALSLRNVAFQLRTDMVSPHCLLLCSNLAQISSKTIYQTAGDHRHTDILALLVENLPGRFVLRNPVNISVQNKDIAKIEFWVRTEAGDVVSCCVGDPLPGEVPVPTRGEVTSIPEMRLFMPMDINQNTAFETKSTIGESVRYLMNQKAGEEFLFNGYADFTLSTWGQHMGVSSTASWNYGIDGTNPNSLATDDFTIIFGTRTSTAILTTAEKVFNCRFFKLRFHNGLIKLLGAATNDFEAVPNISLNAARDYIITIRQMPDVNGNGTHQYKVNVIDLSDYSEQDGVLDAHTHSHNDPSVGAAWWFSDASQHFLSTSGILGPWIMMEGSGDANVATCVSWIKNVYSAGIPVPVSGNNSSFAIEMDV